MYWQGISNTGQTCGSIRALPKETFAYQPAWARTGHARHPRRRAGDLSLPKRVVIHSWLLWQTYGSTKKSVGVDRFQTSFLREYLKRGKVLNVNGNSLISKGKGYPVTWRGWQKEDEDTDLLTLKFCTILRWVANTTPQPLYPREGAPVPTAQGAGWAKGPVWTGMAKIKFLASSGALNPDCPGRNESLCEDKLCAAEYFHWESKRAQDGSLAALIPWVGWKVRSVRHWRRKCPVHYMSQSTRFP